MGEHTIKMPDVGEGVAEAELVEWHVKVGDLVREDTMLAAVMTDKATVEIPSPVEGEIVWLAAEIGETIAVGSPLVRLKVEGEASKASEIRETAPLDDEQGAAPIAEGMAEEGEHLPAPPAVDVAQAARAMPPPSEIPPAPTRQIGRAHV